MTIEHKIKMLILDDRVEQEAEKKGYNQIETRYPGVFEVDRLQSWNGLGREIALDRILNGTTYDIILLDHNFDDANGDGSLVLRQLRDGLADYIGEEYNLDEMRKRLEEWGKSEQYIQTQLGECAKKNEMIREEIKKFGSVAEKHKYVYVIGTSSLWKNHVPKEL